MIARLSGTVALIRGAAIILDVGGVGYLVAVRSTAEFTVGKAATLHTHLAVRENALDLYGFLDDRELHMFEELIKLPKIGPKSAMQILIQADVATIVKAVAEQDAQYLTKLSGIGKKTAEKIVTELKDVFGEGVAGVGVSGTSGDTDLIDALMALGYSQKDARDALQKLPQKITDTNERLKYALRNIGS